MRTALDRLVSSIKAGSSSVGLEAAIVVARAAQQRPYVVTNEVADMLWSELRREQPKQVRLATETFYLEFSNREQGGDWGVLWDDVHRRLSILAMKPPLCLVNRYDATGDDLVAIDGQNLVTHDQAVQWLMLSTAAWALINAAVFEVRERSTLHRHTHTKRARDVRRGRSDATQVLHVLRTNVLSRAPTKDTGTGTKKGEHSVGGGFRRWLRKSQRWSRPVKGHVRGKGECKTRRVTKVVK